MPDVAEHIQLVGLIAGDQRGDFYDTANLGQLFVAPLQRQRLFRGGGIAERVPAGPGGVFNERQFPSDRIKITGLQVQQVVIVSEPQGK
jgi:hypothetical protein